MRDQRHADHKRQPSPTPKSDTAASSSRAASSSTTTPPAGNSTLNAWLNGAVVEAEVTRTSKLLTDIPAEVAAQMQQHIRELVTRAAEHHMAVRTTAQELSAVTNKLKRVEAAMHKLRMDVAAVLEKTFEPREEPKALLEQVAKGLWRDRER